MRIVFIAFWASFGLLCAAPYADSHALHPESVDRFAMLTFAPSHLVIMYSTVLGVNPTERAAKELDPDNDGEITEAERGAFIEKMAQQYAQGQIVRLGGRDLKLEYKTGDAYASFGHNDISVIKIDIGFLCSLSEDLPRGIPLDFSYEDTNVNKAPGWKQIKAQTMNGAVYEGLVPYAEYEPFDYEILNKTGFVPATEGIKIKVTLPESSESGAVLPLQLPPKRDAERPKNHTVEYISLGVAAFLIIAFIAALTYRLRC
ncbi:MAG: hypothetical protein AB1656_12745 [Candidatus Omnitrophota bacterium]